MTRGLAWLDFNGSPSQGLANLATFVIVLAVLNLLNAAYDATLAPNDSFLERVSGTDGWRIALEIFAVVGGMPIIVYLAHLMAN